MKLAFHLLRFPFCLLVLCSLAVGEKSKVARVSKDERLVVVNHEDNRLWKLSDSVCVTRGGKDIACGIITKVTPKAALLKLDASFAGLKPGDSVRLVVSSDRKTASASGGSSRAAINLPRIYNYQVSVGFYGWLSYLFPKISLELTLYSKLSLGLTPTFFGGADGGTSVSAFGAYLKGQYYFDAPYRGLFLQGGPGVFSLTGSSPTLRESRMVGAFLFTAGWRESMRWGLERTGINVGIAGGLQYIFDPNFTEVAVDAVGAQPLLTVDIGYSF